jgi:hypothetical protein
MIGWLVCTSDNANACNYLETCIAILKKGTVLKCALNESTAEFVKTLQ